MDKNPNQPPEAGVDPPQPGRGSGCLLWIFVAMALYGESIYILVDVLRWFPDR